ILWWFGATGERNDIRFVENCDHRRSWRRWQPGCRGNWRRISLRRVGEVNDHICIVESAPRGRTHRFLKRIARTEQPRGVEDNHLCILVAIDANDAIASGLRLRARDAQLLSDDAVEKRRFPDVRFT